MKLQIVTPYRQSNSTTLDFDDAADTRIVVKIHQTEWERIGRENGWLPAEKPAADNTYELAAVEALRILRNAHLVKFAEEMNGYRSIYDTKIHYLNAKAYYDQGLNAKAAASKHWPPA